MPAKNGNIRQFFQLAAPKVEEEGSTIIVSRGNELQPPPPLPAPVDTQSFSSQPRPLSSSQRVIKSSDDEEDEASDSDTSLVDLTELLQSRSNSYRPTSKSAAEPQATGRKKLSRTSQNNSTLPFQPKPNYKFGLKTLVSQSQKHEATEASAQRAKAVLDVPGRGQDVGKQGDKEALLEAVVAGRDSGSVDKILQAVERTEATAAETAWYFFDPNGETPRHEPAELPVNVATGSWQEKLAEKENRESSLRSGFMKEAVMFEGELSEELFMWILDVACMESNEDLAEAYFDILLAAPESIHEYLGPDTVKRMFDRLGARPQATKLKAGLEVVNVCKTAYEKRDWTALKCAIEFLGDAAQFATAVTCSCAMALIARLCADSVVWESIRLFSVVQNSMTELSKAIEGDDLWEISCRGMCSNLYKTVTQAPLCLQILRCMPDSSARLHELRRRLSFATFCRDYDLTKEPVGVNFELWRLVDELDSTRFKITKETDYVELAATMALLDIAIDNGHSAGLDLSDPQAEEDFNLDVDELAYQLKVIWSSINDVGALFISRIDAKEVMDGVRNRLMYTVRTRLKPKASIFDLPKKKTVDEEGARKQSAFMETHFKKPLTNNDSAMKRSRDGDTNIDQTIK